MSEARWVIRLRDELRVLPDTLEKLRIGVDDLRRVAQRLEAATEVLERTQRHMENTGAAQFARDVDDVVHAVEVELTQLRQRMPTTPGDALNVVVQQTEASIDQLNWLAGRIRRSFEPRRDD